MAVKAISISLPEEDLVRLDKLAADAGLSRSAYLATLVEAAADSPTMAAGFQLLGAINNFVSARDSKPVSGAVLADA